MNTDLLRVRLELRGTFWDRRPQYCVRANDQVVAQQTWAGDSGDSEYIEFTLEPQGELGSISVELLNKQPSDTRENLDKTAITHDMLLDIVSIHVDDINLGSLLHTASEYRPQYPQGHVCLLYTSDAADE